VSNRLSYVGVVPHRIKRLEAALRDALKSVLGSPGPAVNPRVEFYSNFQREIEEHDRAFEKKYDEDLNTALIFVSFYSRARAKL